MTYNVFGGPLNLSQRSTWALELPLLRQDAQQMQSERLRRRLGCICPYIVIESYCWRSSVVIAICSSCGSRASSTYFFTTGRSIPTMYGYAARDLTRRQIAAVIGKCRVTNLSSVDVLGAPDTYWCHRRCLPLSIDHTRRSDLRSCRSARLHLYGHTVPAPAKCLLYMLPLPISRYAENKLPICSMSIYALATYLVF